MERTHLDAIKPHRVAVTGMSVACALGLEVDAFWQGLLEGRCGIDVVRRIDLKETPLPASTASEVREEALVEGCNRYGIKDPDRWSRLGLYVVGRALEDAGYPVSGEKPLLLDLVLGAGHGNLPFHHQAVRAFDQRGFKGLRPTTVVRIMFNRISSLCSMHYNIIGANHVVSSACASAAVAIGEAYHRVRFGLVEGAVAACADSGLELTTFAAWNRLKVLSKIPDPERASRPFDVGRKGLVMGEGAAALILESWEAARRRGATILAEVIGFGSSSDAAHIAVPDAEGQARAMRAALASAGIGPEDLDYINAHGTATQPADVSECRAIHLALGEAADRIPVSSNKGQLGHLMGATAGVELVATIQTLREGRIPFNKNLEEPDPECNLNFVRDAPAEAEVGIAMKNSFAFGGNNCAVILKKVESG